MTATQDPASASRASSPATEDEMEGPSSQLTLGKVCTCSGDVFLLIILMQHEWSFRGLDTDATVPLKRARALNASAMMKLAESVSVLVADITKSPLAPPPLPPLTLSHHGGHTSLNMSPVRRDRAFRQIAEHEALTPRRLARARTIFHGRTELADKYLSFQDDELEARREWLNIELAAVAKSSSCSD
jgi:hypothetical protein